jgi:flagellar hook-length control protein FliK
MNIRVLTRGETVDLQIHAADDRARKIIEESLSGLKETLAGHHLSLGQVDVSVAGTNSSQQARDTNQDFRNDSQQGAGFSFLHEQANRDSQQGRKGHDFGHGSAHEMEIGVRPLSLGKRPLTVSSGFEAKPYGNVGSTRRVDIHA